MDFQKVQLLKSKPDLQAVWKQVFGGEGNAGKLRIDEFLKGMALISGDVSFDALTKQLAMLLFESAARGKTMDFK